MSDKKIPLLAALPLTKRLDAQLGKAPVALPPGMRSVLKCNPSPRGMTQRMVCKGDAGGSNWMPSHAEAVSRRDRTQRDRNATMGVLVAAKHEGLNHEQRRALRLAALKG